jgi:branched-chain amino acid transport system substrate-binding protein
MPAVSPKGWSPVKATFRSSLFLALCLLVALAGCAPQATPAPASGSSAPTEGSPYKIGFVVSVTGGASFLGEPQRDTAVMLQEQLDAAGGVVGPDGVRHPVQILIHDTEGTGDVAVPVTKKLIDDDQVVAIVGPSTSPESMALIPIVQEAKVPNISLASSSAIVKPVGERYWVFKVAQSNEHTAPWQVRYVAAKGIERVANIYVNNAYGEDGAEAIRKTAEEEGIEIVLEETFDAADTDMTAQITKIRASNAEAVLVTAIPPAAAVFSKQYCELGIDLLLLHNSGVAMKSFIDLAGEANVEGVIFPMGKLVAADALGDDDPQKAVLQRFVADFGTSTGNPPSTFAAHAWDAIQIIAAGLATLPDGLTIEEQRAQLRDAIESTQGFVGVDGVFNLSAEDHVGLSTDDVVLARITNGDWEYFPPDKW